MTFGMLLISYKLAVMKVNSNETVHFYHLIFILFDVLVGFQVSHWVVFSGREMETPLPAKEYAGWSFKVRHLNILFKGQRKAFFDIVNC